MTREERMEAIEQERERLNRLEGLAKLERIAECAACGGSGKRATWGTSPISADHNPMTVRCGKCGGTGVAPSDLRALLDVAEAAEDAVDILFGYGRTTTETLLVKMRRLREKLDALDADTEETP